MVSSALVNEVVPIDTVSPLMRPTSQTLLAELQRAPLLGQIGQPHTLPHRSVGSWREALELCQSES